MTSAVVAETAHRVAVMYAGRIVEEARRRASCSPRRAIPTHAGCSPPSRASSARRRRAWRRSRAWCPAPPSARSAAPSCRAARAPYPAARPSRRRCAEIAPGHRVACWNPRRMAEPLLRVTGLEVHFPIRSALLRRRTGTVRAVDGVTLEVARGETLGLVGESGCGKTTTGKAMLRLTEPTGGIDPVRRGGHRASFASANWRRSAGACRSSSRTRMPALNPRMQRRRHPRRAASRSIASATRRTARERVAELLRTVGLPPEAASRYPHEFSGGQRQRIGIARALALRPELVIGDEPVSALDVSIQAQIINLMKRLQAELGLAYIFISHDLAVVQPCRGPGRGDVSRPRGRDRARARRCSSRRGIPTPRRCCPPCRNRCPGAGAPATCRRAMCRARPGRHPAATSIPAAHTRCRAAPRKRRRRGSSPPATRLPATW